MDSLPQLAEAIAAGTIPPEHTAECPSCMGSVQIRFIQSIDDPGQVRIQAQCVHCHDEAQSEDRPLLGPVRALILRVDGTWSIRLKDGKPKGEGTHAEMQHLAASLRKHKVAFTLQRAVT